MSEKNWEIKIPKEYQCTDNFYLIYGKKYNRVTRICGVIAKPSLNAWLAKTGPIKSKEILKIRSTFGSTLHKLIEVDLLGEKISEQNYDKYLLDSIHIFQKWKKEHEIITHAVEQHLWSDKFGYAGTADFIGAYDGKLMIGDWKSSKSLYDEYNLQLSAYVQAFYELTGIKVDGIFILQIRDGEYHFITKTYDEIMNNYFPVFLAAKRIYEWENGDI